MKLDTIYSGQILKNQQWNYTLGRGYLNGLVITGGDFSAHDITIRLRHEEGTEVLVQNERLNNLQKISDYFNGSANSTSYAIAKQFGNIINADGADLLDDAVLTDKIKSLEQGSNRIIMMLDLGSIPLERGNEIDIQIEGNGTADVDMTISTYEMERKPAFIYNYEQLKTVNETYFNVDSLFAAILDEDVKTDAESGRPVDLATYDIDFKVSDDQSTYLSTFMDSQAITYLIGKYEVYWEEPFAGIYLNELEVPVNVHVKITGSDASLVTIYNRSIHYIQKITSDSTIDELQDLRQRVEEIERKQPELAKALRHAGKTVKSEELAQAEQQIKEAQKQDQQNKEA